MYRTFCLWVVVSVTSRCRSIGLSVIFFFCRWIFVCELSVGEWSFYPYLLFRRWIYIYKNKLEIINSHCISSEKLLIAFSVWCLSVKCHFCQWLNGLYIQTNVAVNCLPATSDRYLHKYAQKWWSGKLLKKKFHIREILFHSWQCGSRAPFLGGSRMIWEGSHVCFQRISFSEIIDNLTC